MKIILPLLIFLFGIVEAQKIECYHPDSAYVIKEVEEFIDMGGVSSNSYYEFISGKVRFLAWDNKKPKVRLSKNEYLSAKINLELHSNCDTGRDEIRIYSNGVLLFNYDFTDDFLVIGIKPSQVGKLKFVVLNSTMKNKTAGAFEARIWIEGKAFVKRQKKKS